MIGILEIIDVLEGRTKRSVGHLGKRRFLVFLCILLQTIPQSLNFIIPPYLFGASRAGAT